MVSHYRKEKDVMMKIIPESKAVPVDDFWYDLTTGGYIKPHDMLESKEDIERVIEAIRTLEEFEEALAAHFDYYSDNLEEEEEDY